MMILFINLPLDMYPQLNRPICYNTIPPYGIGYIASVSSKYIGRENVSFIDAEYQGLSLGSIIEKIEFYDPELIGVNVSSVNFHVFVNLLNIISERYVKRLIIGGPHAILCPRDFFKIDVKDLIKFVCLGEGELVFAQLFQGYKIKDIENICYKDDNGVIVTNPKQTPIDFNNIEIDRSFFANDFNVDNGKQSSYMITSRGCPNNCSFCAAPCLYRNQFFLRNRESLFRELEYLIHKGVKHIRFIDDLFLYSSKRILDFIKVLSELKLDRSNFSFEATGRIDILSKLDDKLWNTLSMYGLSELEIGIESGSNRILKSMNKGFSIETIYKVIEKCVYYGITIKAFIICGYYTETVQDKNETIALCRKLKDICKNKIRFSATPAKAYPGTLLYHQMVSCGHVPVQEYMYVDLLEYSYGLGEEKMNLLKARTRYNAMHRKDGIPVALSEMSGSCDTANVIQELIQIALISGTPY